MGRGRRDFLKAGIGSGAALFLSRCARPHSLSSSTAASSAQGTAYVTVHKSQDGLLSLDLTAEARRLSLGLNSSTPTANLLTYNGQIPGPRLEARPGDTVQIRFTNDLRQPTNLHFHGLHIPPTSSGDNVFLEVPPGERYTWEFQIPKDHRAGTFWYHPHRHGLVAEQLFGGLAGLFVVRGDLDEIPEIQSAEETFLVLKDFSLDRQGNIPNPGHMAQMSGRIGNLLTANGQINYPFEVIPGGLLRLRLLNACPSRFLRLVLEGHRAHLIATDGGAIAAPIPLDEWIMAPGERLEVLIAGDQPPGQYRLLNYPFNPAQGGMNGMGMGSRNSETVATLTYRTASNSAARSTPTATASPASFPRQLMAPEPLPAARTTRQFTLSHGMGGGMGGGMGMNRGMVFLINGQAFAHRRVDTRVALGSVEDWEIINTGTFAHPFHVHVNKFQILSRNGEPSPYLAWKDIVSVAPGERVVIRTAFRDYPGKTVYHCHVLDHEDLGMMGVLEIS